MKAQHTPGPWTIEMNSPFNQIGNRLIIRAEKPSENLWEQICEVGIINTGLMGGDREANATLIAAAPDMLEELTKAHNFINVFLSKVPAGYLPKDWTDAMYAGLKAMDTVIKKAQL